MPKRSLCVKIRQPEKDPRQQRNRTVGGQGVSRESTGKSQGDEKKYPKK